MRLLVGAAFASVLALTCMVLVALTHRGHAPELEALPVLGRPELGVKEGQEEIKKGEEKEALGGWQRVDGKKEVAMGEEDIKRGLAGLGPKYGPNGWKGSFTPTLWPGAEKPPCVEHGESLFDRWCEGAKPKHSGAPTVAHLSATGVASTLPPKEERVKVNSNQQAEKVEQKVVSEEKKEKSDQKKEAGAVQEESKDEAKEQADLLKEDQAKAAIAKVKKAEQAAAAKLKAMKAQQQKAKELFKQAASLAKKQQVIINADKAAKKALAGKVEVDKGEVEIEKGEEEKMMGDSKKGEKNLKKGEEEVKKGEEELH